MTTDLPPSCETCPSQCRGDWCERIIAFDKSKKYRRQEDVNGEKLSKYTKMTGCLYHPLSRAWLNRDVIRELEERNHSAVQLVNFASSKNEETYNEGKSFAYKEAIALLKGGDGK